MGGFGLYGRMGGRDLCLERLFGVAVELEEEVRYDGLPVPMLTCRIDPAASGN